MKVFSDNRKILITQIVSYTTFALALLGKNYSTIGSVLKPYKYYIIGAFFLAQALMAFLIFQESKRKAAANSYLKESDQQ